MTNIGHISHKPTKIASKSLWFKTGNSHVIIQIPEWAILVLKQSMALSNKKKPLKDQKQEIKCFRH